MEILFEQDNEEKSVATLILDALVKVETSGLLYMTGNVRGARCYLYETLTFNHSFYLIYFYQWSCASHVFLVNTDGLNYDVRDTFK